MEIPGKKCLPDRCPGFVACVQWDRPRSNGESLYGAEGSNRWEGTARSESPLLTDAQQAPSEETGR